MDDLLELQSEQLDRIECCSLQANTRGGLGGGFLPPGAPPPVAVQTTQVCVHTRLSLTPCLLSPSPPLPSPPLPPVASVVVVVCTCACRYRSARKKNSMGSMGLVGAPAVYASYELEEESLPENDELCFTTTISLQRASKHSQHRFRRSSSSPSVSALAVETAKVCTTSTEHTLKVFFFTMYMYMYTCYTTLYVVGGIFTWSKCQ